MVIQHSAANWLELTERIYFVSSGLVGANVQIHGLVGRVDKIRFTRKDQPDQCSCCSIPVESQINVTRRHILPEKNS